MEKQHEKRFSFLQARRLLFSCFAVALVLFSIPLPASAAPVDIYDATSLRNALKSGEEITLWQDITYDVYSSILDVSEDSSIDLNGYTLTAACGLQVAKGKSLTVCDRYSESEKRGEMKISRYNGAAIFLYPDSTLTLDSGVMTLQGANNKRSRNYFGDGIRGEHASLIVRGGKLTAIGGNGYDYRDGTAWSQNRAQNANDGIYVSEMIVDNGEVTAVGGNGVTNYSEYFGHCGAGIRLSDGALTINGGTIHATGGITVPDLEKYPDAEAYQKL